MFGAATDVWAATRDVNGGAEDGLGLDGSEEGDLGMVDAGDRARDEERVGRLAHDNLWVNDETISGFVGNRASPNFLSVRTIRHIGPFCYRIAWSPAIGTTCAD